MGYINGYTNGIIMKVSEKRWGEVTVKKQGKEKNDFDKTLSFSVEQTDTNYTIEEYREILKKVTNLTKDYHFEELLHKLDKLDK